MSSANAPRASSKNVNASRKIVGSSRSRISKNDPGASHSRLAGASSRVASSTMHAGGGSGGQSTQVYLDGVNVTPQTLLYTRIKTAEKGVRGGKNKKAADDPTTASSATIPNQSTTSVFSDGDVSSGGSDSTKSIEAILASTPNMKATPTLSASTAPKKMDMPLVPQENDDGDGLSVIDDGHLELSSKQKTDRDSRPGTALSAPVKVEGPVTFHFTETPTIMLYEWHSICVGQDTPEHGNVVTKNRKYLEMCASKKGSDNYVENRTQTLQLAQKTKEVMTAPPATRDVACHATDWDIYDCDQNDLDNGGNDHDEMGLEGNNNSVKSKAMLDTENVDAQLTKQVDEIVSASLASPGCLLLTEGPDLLNDLKARQRALQPSRHKGASHPQQSHHTGNNESKANFSRASRLVQNSNVSVSSIARAPNNISSATISSNGGGGSSANVTSQSDINSSGDINSGSRNDISRSSNNSDGVNSTDGGKTVNAYSNANTNVDIGEIIAEQKTRRVLQSTSLNKTLRVLERAVQQNFYHERHLLYRNFPLLRDNLVIPSSPRMLKDEASNASQRSIYDKSIELEKLWGFRCELTDGRAVSCLAWNPVNDDLLAVSYGQFGAGDIRDGLVLFWSLKNPEYPERIYTLSCGVTSIDFSRMHPNLLAVGFRNGVVALFDTRKEGNEPILSSESNSGSHLDAVWQVKWVHKGSERGESIVSISSDGRVTEWSMKKGLSYSDLMTLKRVPNPLVGSEARIDGVIARQASGNCIEFAQNDSSVYFVGTEDGNIHKCSCSYNEQYLETYFGHTASVYAIHMSPFWNQILLSCSADWTVKLWHQAEQREVLSFRSVDLQHGVYGIGWCPNDATIFGSVTEDGRIEIWDLEQSVLDPIITHFPKENVDCTCISFAPSSPVLTVGDSTGEVGVYRVPTLAEGRCEGQSLDDQIERLRHAIKPHEGG